MHKPDKDTLKTFSPFAYLTEQTLQHVSTRQQTLADYMERVLNFALGFFNGNEDPHNGSTKLGGAYGLTAFFEDWNGQERLYLWLNYAVVIPLLRDDLGDVERMGCEWALAKH